MTTSLKDGTGTNKLAKVDDEHRLYTLSNIIPHPQHHSMTHGNLFIVGFCAELQSTDPEALGVFVNIDTDIDFEFYITLLNADASVDIVPRFDDLRLSGGEVVTPQNLNRGSGLPLPTTRATIYQGGAAGDLTLDGNGVNWGPTLYIAARDERQIDFQGGLIISNSKSISFTAQGAVGTKVCALAMCSYHEAGKQL